MVDRGRKGFVVFNPVGEHSKGKRLDRADRLVGRASLRHRRKQIDDFGEPTAVVFSFKLDGESGCSLCLSWTNKS